MSIKPYYTSNTLIEAVERGMAMPLTQVTFLPADILAFANAEIFSSQMPSILQYHEEYYVYTQEITLETNKSRYPIPNRAVGMKLRDLFYKDQQGNLIEMSKINPDDKAFFNSGATGTVRSPIHYYVQNNSIVITPEVGVSPTGSLVFSYFLRPNSLVPNEEAVICASFSKTITLDNTTMANGDTLTINGSVMTVGTEFAKGVNTATTATNLSSYLATIGYTASANSSIVTVSYFDHTIEFSTSNTAAFTISSSITVNSTADVPEGFVDGVLVDFLQTDGGHSTYSFDVLVGTNAVSQTSVTFSADQIPEDFVVGDYICLQYECIVPQVPTDLHNIVVERTIARILEAQRDEEGLKAANLKIQDLESRQSILIDNRVDGSPQKVLNLHSHLRYGKSSRRRGW